MSTDFKEQTVTKKGDVGEDIVDNLLHSKGIHTYKPSFDGPHPIDRLCFENIDNGYKLYALDVKTKELRLKYPDTGYPISNYEVYCEINKTTPVLILFIDKTKREIYGNYLSELNKKVTVNDWNYPDTKNKDNIIYFPYCSMKVYANLTDVDIKEIEKYNILKEQEAARKNLDAFEGLGLE